MPKKIEEPNSIEQEKLAKIVEQRRKREAEESEVDCTTDIRYEDRSNARVTFLISGNEYIALYELTGSGWYCRLDWRD